MRLNELRIQNFRKIEEITVLFPPGLSVIVGENNVGKTAIIDALRLMLFSGRDFDSLRLNEDDFRCTSGLRHSIEITCKFCDLSDDEEAHFQECLVDIGDGKFEVQLNSRVEFNTSTRRANVKMWGGETEGGYLPNNLYDKISAIYLKPLRDPESGLKPGRNSQISHLVDCLAEDTEHEGFENIAKEANNKIKDLEPVKEAKNDIDAQMTAIAGYELTQKTELIFSDPTFHRIIAGLQPEIEGLPFSLNGLGYNNLIFTATTLGTLRRSDQFAFRSILVEEPEAHLHPQLQVLLLRHLGMVAEEEKGNNLQVIATSHSPILVSQAPIDSVISVHETAGVTSAVSIGSIPYDKKLKMKLQRYLDATRAELFFAKNILMVEGVAEALLIPVLTCIAGGCLKDAAVTVINAEGLNFNAFLPLFGEGRLRIPVAILTDGDDKKKTGSYSATTAGLKKQESTIDSLKVEFNTITFEHELAKSPILLPFMVKAFKILHPKIGQKLHDDLKGISNSEDKADEFLRIFLEKGTSKGKYAQELANTLSEEYDLCPDVVPNYILRALSHLSVI